MFQTTVSSRRIAPQTNQVRLAAAGKPGRAARHRVSAVVENKLVLKSVGDGDASHLGKVEISLAKEVEVKVGTFEIGREEPAEILLPIPTVSARHCLITLEGGAVSVTDLGSTNGTFINGEEVKPMEAVPLPLGAEVIFGDEHLAKFQLAEEADPAPAPASEVTEVEVEAEPASQ